MMYLLPERSYSTMNHIHHTDALTLLRALPSGYVDLAVYDFPYMGVKEDAWDNQWKTVADYLAWLQPILSETKRVLKPNGSFYGFASPQMSARVEIAVQEFFNVLNNIVWVKPDAAGAEKGVDTLRTYAPQSERIIFAEPKAPSGHSPMAYTIQSARLNAGLKHRDLKDAYTSPENNPTGLPYLWEHDKSDGGCIPTLEQYQRLQALLPDLPEYEDIHRPFEVSRKDSYTDVWNYAPVAAYPGKHPCEKPLDMMQQIIRASSRPGGIVLDCFAGSGATLDAARRLGRKYIGCDMDAGYVRKARARLATPYMLSMFNLLPAKVEPPVMSVPVQQAMAMF